MLYYLKSTKHGKCVNCSDIKTDNIMFSNGLSGNKNDGRENFKLIDFSVEVSTPVYNTRNYNLIEQNNNVLNDDILETKSYDYHCILFCIFNSLYEEKQKKIIPYMKFNFM